MKKVYLLGVLLFFALQVFSQKEIMLGARKFAPKENVEEYISGKRKLPELSSYNDKNYVLLQFSKIPTKKEKEALKAKGILLNSYTQNNTYYATIKKGELALQLTASSVISINEIIPEWKTSSDVLEGIIPEHAKVNDDIAKVNIIYFQTAEIDHIHNLLKSKGVRVIHSADEFQTLTAEMPIVLVRELATQPWLKWIEYIGLPETIDNIQGRTMNRSSILSENGLGGRNLTGKGVNIGVWDGSVQQHPDLGNRLHTIEYEMPSEHGMHVSGTVAGAGIIDSKARGMAPEAHLYTYNFGNPKSNKMTTQQEMLSAAEQFDISITQNSYGVSLRNNCGYVAKYEAGDAQLDQIVNKYFPTLTHVFSAGNNQSDCLPSHYSTSTKRTKNVILVGALDEATEMSYFSSWGPMDDGRLLPHICSFGVNTYSTIYNNSYGEMSGTSMATPAVSGTVALLYQRYQELKNEKPLASLIKAAVCNTAEDRGNPGPDYSYGYGVINALKAVETFEKNQFAIGSVENAEEFTFDISVPANAEDLRVMLVWSDYYGTVSTQKALVNDLDLLVINNGKETRPWVLDHNNPEKDAFKGIDNLNNAEQVTINKPSAGTYTVKVTGTEVPKGPQEFSVVFYYHTPQLQIIYPNGNEKFNPGEKIVVRWESSGHKGNQTIEFSADNGETFKSLASNIPTGTNDYIISLPEITTGKALIRIIQDGTTDVSDAIFSIAQAPENIEIVAPDCGTDGWALTWDAVANADKYEILKADVNNGVYLKIGESLTTSFDLPSLTKDRNIFAVASVKGDAVSKRSYGFIANPSVPLDLATTDLPFIENFVHYPSDFVSLKSGVGTSFGYTPTLFSYDQAHSLYLSGSESTTEWNTVGDVFANNPEDVISAKICQIDASHISENLWMRTAAVTFNSGEETNVNFRVLANGDQLQNTFGQNIINKIESGQNIMYWNLSDYAGKTFSLDFQAALRNPTDSIHLGYIKIYQPKYDISIYKLTSAEKSSTLTSENEVTVTVKNNSGEPISNIPVSYSINDGTPVYEVIEGPLAPFTKMVYTFTKKADFSTPNTAYHIVANVTVTGDKDETNNSTEFYTANLGDYFVIPNTKSLSNTKKVTSDALLFTDDGAKVLDYSNGFKGSVTFKPTTTGNKVKIKITEFDVEENFDVFEIYDGNSFVSSPKITSLSGGSYTLPLEYTATNNEGELTVVFNSDTKNPNEGWLAEVSEVDQSGIITANTLTLTSIVKYNGYYPAETPIEVNIKNNSASDVENVLVEYKIDEGDWSTEENIGAIAANTEEKYLALSELASLLPLGTEHTITVRIVNVDDNMEDNISSRTIINDRYCFSFSASSASNGLFHITNVSKGDVENPTSAAKSESSRPSYYRSVIFPVYNDLSSQVLEVEINEHQAGGKIAVWIDWNDNDDYEDDGTAYNLTTSEGTTVYNIPITIPDGTTLGEKFMRVRATTASVLDPCAAEYSENGEVEDYMVELLAQYPIKVDLSVTETTLASGIGLSNSETITATISNNASVAISNFDIAFKVNGGTEVKETVTTEIAPLSTIDYTFTATADLSVNGSHTLEIYTLATGDMVADNDKLSKNIINSVVATNGFYALDFDGIDDLVDVGTLNDANLQDFTYEAWINPKSYGGHAGPIGFGRLFQGKAATIFLHGETNTNYPNHSLVVSVGGGSLHTIENTIDLNEWQHIAVSFDNSAKVLKIYINGVETSVVARKEPTTIADNSTNRLYIGNNASLERAFKGMIDEARVWNLVRTEQNIKDGLYNHVASTETGLLAQFSFDEGFYNSNVYSGAITASIQNAEFSEDEGSIWVEPTKLIHDVKFNNQVCELKEIVSNHFVTEVTNATDLTMLTADFELTYPNVSVSINGVNQVSNVTENDFSNSMDTPLQIDFNTTVFGKSISESIQFGVKHELSDECTLEAFSLLKSINTGLTADLIASPVSQTIKFDVNNSIAVDALVPTLTISAGATAFVNGTEISSEVSSINFSEPILLTVTAANGRASKSYAISLRRSQEISWAITTDKIYGDLDFNIGATASSDLGVSYTSSNTEVIRIAGRVAQIVGAGSAIITANQIGNNTILPAASVQKVFNVSKAPLTITADNKVVDYTLPIPELTVSYSGWLNGETIEVIDDQPSVSTVASQNSSSGDYPIVLTGGTDNNYNLILVDGTLTINEVTAFDANFTVSDDTDFIDGAQININNQSLITDVDGKATLQLINGDYNYTVTKAGFANYTGSLTISDANLDENVILSEPLPIFTLTYTSDGNGILIGEATQKVEQGSDGSEILTTASNGYHFVQWSDASTENPRTDLNIQTDLNIEAQFAVNNYTLSYNAGTNGSLTGDASQNVQHGNDGTEIQASPATGYAFVQWSDGLKNNPRTDINVSADIDVTAEYTKVYTLPYTQGFGAATMPEDWQNISNVDNDNLWEFKIKSNGLSGATGNYAIMDSDGYGSGGNQDADLISPIFDLSTYSTVHLKFSHYFKSYSSSAATLSYRIGNGNWVEINSWTGSSTGNPESFEQEIAAVAGQDNVSFKWNYVGSWGYYWCVDDLEITGTVPASKYSVTYAADENGTIAGEMNQVVDHGANGTPVTAVPNIGYLFTQWSDGLTDNPRTETDVIKVVNVTAQFTKDCSPISSLPFFEDFNASNSIPDCWNTPESDAGYTWKFGFYEKWGTKEDIGTTGNNAYFNSSAEYHSATQVADLLSPEFDLSSYSTVYLSFTHLFKQSYDKNAFAEVSYSLDGGTSWISVKKWTESLSAAEEYNQLVDGVAGQSNVLFKFTYQGKWDFGWIIDDIQLKESGPIVQYTLAYNAAENGSIQGTSIQTVNAGTNGTEVTAVADAGYHFTKWSDGETANPRTDVNVQADITVSAEFAIDPTPEYTLTYIAGENGSLEGTLVQTVEKGSDASAVKAVADAGYHFTQWSDGGTANPRTDVNVQLDMTVTAEFVIDPTPEYTLTYIAGANGILEGTLVQTVEEGSDASAVKAVADEGYHFTQWSDGETANPRTDINVQLDMTVTAEFVIDPTPEYTITYIAGANGTLEGTLVQTVEEGSDASAVKAVADEGYHFTQWSDGETANPRTDTNVQSNMTIEAQFAANVYNLKFVVSSSENFLSGVIIAINDQELMTNTLGEAEIMLKDGTYDYSILIDGYSVFSSSLTISGEDVLETVTIATTGIDEVLIEEIRVYPNPVVRELNVRCNDIRTIKVFNVIGKVVLVYHNNNNKLSEVKLNFSNLKQGLYLVRIELENNQVITKKVIK